MRNKDRVLFVCVHNSARSQMAEEYLRYFGNELFEVESAGLEPGTINPYVVEVLQEEGIDISAKQSQKVWDLYKAGNLYSYVITGSRDEILQKTREVRNVIKEMIQQFIEAYRNNQAPPEYSA